MLHISLNADQDGGTCSHQFERGSEMREHAQYVYRGLPSPSGGRSPPGDPGAKLDPPSVNDRNPTQTIFDDV